MAVLVPSVVMLPEPAMELPSWTKAVPVHSYTLTVPAPLPGSEVTTTLPSLDKATASPKSPLLDDPSRLVLPICVQLEPEYR